MSAAPAGTPYDRLALTEQHLWWRPLVATLVAVAGWFLLVIMLMRGMGMAASLAGVEVGTGDALFADPLWDTTALLLVLALMLPSVLFAARMVQHRPAGTLSSVTGRIRGRWLLACLGVSAAAIPLLLGLGTAFSTMSGGGTSVATSGAWAGWPTFLAGAAMTVLLVPLQAAAEEYVFRGWIPQAFGSYLRAPWVGIAVAGVLFALAHGLGTPWGFAELVLFSLVMSVLVLRTGGLEAAIALHVVTNLVAFLAAAPFTNGVSDDSTAADSSWEMLAAGAIVLPLYAWVVLRLSRRFRIARTSPEPTARLAGPPAPRWTGWEDGRDAQTTER